MRSREEREKDDIEDIKRGKLLVNQYLQRQTKGCYYDSDEFVSMVRYALSCNKVELAHELIGIALRLHPDSLEIQIKASDVCCAEGKFQESLNILESSVAPNDYEVLYCKGLTYLDLNQPDQAIETFDTIVAQSHNIPEWPLLIFDIARSFNESEAAYATKYFQIAYEIDPKDRDVLDFYALNATYLCDYKKAISLLNQLIDLDAYDSFAWQKLAYVHINDDNPQEALDAIEYAIMLSPSDYEMHFIKARCLLLLNRPQESIDYLRDRFNNVSDEDAVQQTLILLSEAYQSIDDHENAKKCLQQVIESFPDLSELNPEILGNYIMCYIKQEQFSECHDILKCLVRLHPNDSRLWLFYAECNAALGHFNNAIKGYNQVLAIDGKDDCGVLCSMAAIYLEKKNYQAAIRTYQRAWSLNIDRGIIAIGLAIAYLQLGNEAKALNHYLYAHNHKDDAEKIFLEIYPNKEQANLLISKANKQLSL